MDIGNSKKQLKCYVTRQKLRHVADMAENETHRFDDKYHGKRPLGNRRNKGKGNALRHKWIVRKWNIVIWTGEYG
jgi:hypothetical protein